MRKNNKSRIEVKRIVNSISENDKEKKCKYIPINTSDVYDGSFNANAYVDYSDLKGQFKKKFKKGDILFSEIRPIQKHFALIDFDETEDYLVSTKLMVLRNCNKEVDTRYFYYWLTSSDTLNKLQKMAENRIASFPQITFDENLSNLLVPLHTIEHQKKISNLIDMIDRLLKINSLINDNLYDYDMVA